MKQQSVKSQKFSFKILGFSLVLFACVLVFFEIDGFFNKTTKEKDSSSEVLKESSESILDPDQLVDQHLKETQINVYNRKEQIQFQKNIDENRDFEAYHPGLHLNKKPIPLELNGPGVQEKITKDLNKEGSPFKLKPTTPDEYLKMELFQASEKEKLDEAYKEAFARHFIENARRDGWEIKLNTDYKVISVKPLRRAD